ncbi:MAG: DUF72 domain-containing protein [Acetobacteraceae bacterium]|nr:DUF72 domain-containing protein [Acetobacteraceae bacterium]
MQLARYSGRFCAVEVNSTFYRSHRAETYAKWAASVPAEFRFALKLPRAITHERRLVGAERVVAAFLDESAGLGAKRGPLLVQSPPRLGFDAVIAGKFFATLRRVFPGVVACEPRHAGWFGAEADRLLCEFEVARVIADRSVTAEGVEPGGWPRFVYLRLHGSPRMYWSAYDDTFLDALTRQLRAMRPPEIWRIFDNTAAGAVLENALDLLQRIGG